MSKIKHLTPEQQAVVDRLRLHQARLKQTNRAFHASKLAKHFSYTVWHRLVTDNYTGDVAGMIATCEKIANSLDAEQRSTALATAHDGRVYQLDHVLACEASVQECAESVQKRTDDKKRITVLLGETGAGKTATARWLYNTLGQNRKLFPGGALLVEATPSWRTYKSVLQDFAAALGLGGPWRDTQAVEADVVTELRKRGPTLVLVDECQYFSAQSADFTKFFTNQTPAVLFLASDPVLWEEFKKRSWSASSQIVNRCRAVIRVNQITADDVLPFLEPFGLNGSARGVATLMAKAATSFGRFDRVKDLVWWMGEKHNNEWTEDNVRNVIYVTEKNLGLVE